MSKVLAVLLIVWMAMFAVPIGEIDWISRAWAEDGGSDEGSDFGDGDNPSDDLGDACCDTAEHPQAGGDDPDSGGDDGGGGPEAGDDPENEA
jgi:hypothetical protein